MNVLEQYIKEIHSVVPYEADWTKKFDRSFVQVDITTECYGRVDRNKRVFGTDEWAEIKEQGYYMA